MNYSAAMLALLTTFMTTHVVEKISPVVVWMRMSEIQIDGNLVRGRVTGYKIKECRFVPNTFSGWYRERGIWKETKFKFVDDPSPNSTRPKQWEAQDFGIWQWHVIPNADAVKLSTQHECDGEIRLTNIGPFEL